MSRRSVEIVGRSGADHRAPLPSGQGQARGCFVWRRHSRFQRNGLWSGHAEASPSPALFHFAGRLHNHAAGWIAIAAALGTTLAPWGLAFIQSYAVDKKITVASLRWERVDVLIGSILTGVIGLAIAVSCAATLHEAGVHIEDAGDAAVALKPLAGKWVLIVDADEFLVLPPGIARVGELTARMDRHGVRAARALMLDFFPQSLDLLAEELRLAQNALNAITGEFTSDDLLGVIFSRFCIGK